MSHYDEVVDTVASLASAGTRTNAPDARRVPDAARTTVDTDRDLNALRRNLLVYGTAGQVARLRRENLLA